jgi:hypothetical protein
MKTASTDKWSLEIAQNDQGIPHQIIIEFSQDVDPREDFLLWVELEKIIMAMVGFKAKLDEGDIAQYMGDMGLQVAIDQSQNLDAHRAFVHGMGARMPGRAEAHARVCAQCHKAFDATQDACPHCAQEHS